MESYAAVLNYGIPFFLILIIAEWIWSYYKGVEVNRSFDTVSSLSSGITNIVKDVLGIAIIVVSYKWMYEHIAIFDISAYWWVFVVTFILEDFSGYWAHRWEHEINIFWNRHMIHHSSEEYNLACALRQNVSAIVGVFFFLYIPMAIIGVPPKVIAIVAPIQLFAQFWYHTRLIDKMGNLEKILVTPSHHRVHHAINDEYIDKNFSQIFIVWDKWFGTFQEELDDVPPVYGIKKPAKTWNPILINFQHAWIIAKDAYHTKSWKDKLLVWFKPTGWRPADVIEKHPIEIITNPYTQKKYDTEGSIGLKIWSFLQLTITVVMTLFMFNHIADYNFAFILLGGLFVMVSVFAYTTLMDRHQFAIVPEMIKVAIGMVLISTIGGWFGISSIVFSIYLLLSLGLTAYFSFVDKKGIVADVEYAGERV